MVTVKSLFEPGPEVMLIMIAEDVVLSEVVVTKLEANIGLGDTVVTLKKRDVDGSSYSLKTIVNLKL